MRTLIDNDDVRVSAIEHTSDVATLCFTGIGHAIGGVDIQSEEFLKASCMSTAYFIIDKNRSWGNSIDFAGIAEEIGFGTKAKTINSIGNSMGGFLAVLATKFFPISSVVAICPQFSVSKRVIPSEARFDSYVNKINNWKHESLADCFNSSTSYYILAGVGGADDKHLDLIPQKDNIHKIYFHNSSFLHNVAQRLKADGLLYDVLGDCFRREAPREIVRARLSQNDYLAFVA